ncbi:signal-transducing adaptor protein 1-like [Aplochiton taeniatus]
MSVPPRVVNQRRATITALPLYYYGSLLKKYTGEKDFKKFYGELRGCTLFLYTDEVQSTYAEKLDLQVLKSMDFNSPYLKKAPTIFTLSLQNEEVQLKMDNPDTAEEWRAFILTIATKEIPKKLQLLPGQRLRLQEVLAQEIQRRGPPLPQNIQRPRTAPSFSASNSLNEYDDGISGIPGCFFAVSRQEAEQMLEDNPSHGSIILRPSTNASNYAVTLRQVFPSGPVMKNYKISSGDSDFVIELESLNPQRDTPGRLPSSVSS